MEQYPEYALNLSLSPLSGGNGEDTLNAPHDLG